MDVYNSTLASSSISDDCYRDEDGIWECKPATPRPNPRSSSKSRTSPSPSRPSQGDAVLINFMGDPNHSEFARKAGEEPLPVSDDADSELDDSIRINAKERRGRVAVPGRCHSCNRAEVPEWPRGPDGPETLYNACGPRKFSALSVRRTC